ncbi:MAG TPA: 3-hydroxyacyl-CoA dehydrogenase NAD-binding domain-containing protein, partial [Actinomycetota bacterium]|nr:3-hydroxyacyl-CoA dehydrogenase NAD-binding domain-containing protein [Actinomycetota bacterium]
MIPRVRQAVVLGAGTMGAQLACLLAGAGAEVRLLDLDRGLAEAGLERASKLRPTPLHHPSHVRRIRPGGLDELAGAVAGADWVLEAVVEDLGAKRDLLARVDEALAGRDRAPLVTTNTSGLPVRAMAEGRSEAFRAAFCGAHFFNPPRYTRLLEVVPTADTDPGRVAALEELASRHLGKGTVRAKDTPAFIANRLGVHGMLTALALALELGLGPDEVDDLTGPLLGRPRSATFRTLDLVGLDVALAVADHCHAALADDPERERFRAPDVLRELVARGALGEKSGAGFYRREDGEILALDLGTLAYRPRRRAEGPAVARARDEADPARRIRILLEAEEPAGAFVRRLLASTLRYAAAVGPEVADDADTVDRTMRWGFGWERGPFETWDLLGPAEVAKLVEAEGGELPPAARAVVDRLGTFHREADGARETLSFAALSHVPVPARPGTLDPAELRARARRAGSELPSNASASLVDLGEGILGLELHGKLNVIGFDTIDLLERAVALAEERSDGLVIGTRAPDFSAGANLALILMAAEAEEWDELEVMVRRFQRATRAMRRAAVPVVAAPRGRTLGGG